ncbi:AAA family ATPase [Paenibacillus ihuae]|uniref:AAA family ATPase n=1 Tax=Paenibacillus ihuae TaxID=1232431 RepID=UPI0006D5403F|nr:AAA family ATPase [Paenibacillus ihuae]
MSDSIKNGVSLHDINYSLLDKSLRRFNKYRVNNEEEYQNERQLKVEIMSVIGPILRNLEMDSQHMIDRLIQVTTGEGKNRKVYQNIYKLFKGWIWRDNFRRILQYSELVVILNLLQDLLEQGITVEIKERFREQYRAMIEAHGSIKPKTNEVPVPLLAMLLASYNPDKYVLYIPKENFDSFGEHLGLIIPNDVVERYTLYNQVANMILNYAKKKGYNVQDLLDVYHVVNMTDKYENVTGGFRTVMSNSQPINKILYGPPGTGKTYNVIYEALSILNPEIDSDIITNPQLRDEAVALFNQYVDSNHIMFCTFHQSYSYEEFVEGIRFSDEKKQYEVQDGIFKRLCNAARATYSELRETYKFDPDQTQFFKMSLGNTGNSDEDEVYDYCISNNEIALGWGENVDFSKCQNKQAIRGLYESQLPDENPYGAEFVERFKHWMRIGDIVVISHGNKKVRAIGKITSEYNYRVDSPIAYHQFRGVQWLYENNEAMLPVQSVLREKFFSQQTIYMFDKKDLNMDSIKELISGIREQGEQDQQYILIIDEVNRGNISKIFGELITLIEPDKRTNQKNELSVTLPYSGDRLRVPSNVHIIGTMNTADRSISLIDTALRRRFEFVEMLPDYSLLPSDVEGVNIKLLVETINQRIEYLYDRDHVIGHAYFLMDNPQIENYIAVMLSKVIPLLQEYFYDDWEQIELVLGGSGKPRDNSYFLNRVVMQADKLFAKKSGSLEPIKARYFVQTNPTVDALKRIYNMSKNQAEQDDEE